MVGYFLEVIWTLWSFIPLWSVIQESRVQKNKVYFWFFSAFRYAASLFCKSATAFNPFIYFFLSKGFRQDFVIVMHRLCFGADSDFSNFVHTHSGALNNSGHGGLGVNNHSGVGGRGSYYRRASRNSWTKNSRTIDNSWGKRHPFPGRKSPIRKIIFNHQC